MDKACKYQAVIEYMSNIDCFNSYNGIKLTKLEDNYAEGCAELTGNSLNPNGKVHGGLIFALSDYIGGFVASGDRRSCVTQGASFSFLRPAIGAYLTSKAEAIKIGSNLAIVDVSTYDDQDKLVAKGTFTYFFTDQNF